MRIAVMAPEDLPVPPVRGGSVQIYADALTRALAAMPGLEVTLLAPRPAASGADAPPEHGGEYGRRLVHLPGGAPFLSAAAAYLAAWDPDWIQVENRPAWVNTLRALAPRARILLNLHSLTFLGPRHIHPMAARQALCSADAVVLNSRFLLRAVTRRFRLRTAAWHPVVIHPGVDLVRFAPPDAHAAKRRTRLRIVYVGRVVRQKGVHVLLTAVRRLHRLGIPVHATIIGRAPPWERAYAARIRRLLRGLPARWIGFVPPARLPPYLWQHDVLVCPSQGPEAFGLVNVEAMAAGLAVVASRQGGIREAVGDAGVLVAKFRQPEAFAAALIRLARRPDQLRRLQQAARARAQAFTWTRTAARFAAIYRAARARSP